MTEKYRIFLMGLNPKSDVEGVYGYLSGSLGISDHKRRQQLVYNSPGLVCETDSLEEAQKIRDALMKLGAKIEIKKPTPAPENSGAQSVSPKKEPETAPNRASLSGVVVLVLEILVVVSVVAGLAAYLKRTHLLDFKTPPSKKSLAAVGKKRGAETSDAPATFAFAHDAPIFNMGLKTSGPLAEISQEIKKGDYPKAWGLLKDYLAENPRDEEAIKSLKYLALKLGKQSYDAGKRDDAEGYMETALQYAPEDPDLYAQLGALFYEKNEYDKARDYLEDAIRYGSKDCEVHLILAKLFYFHDDKAELAVTHLEKALEIQPNRKDIKTFLDKIRKESNLERNFKSAQSDHFIVKYEGVEDQDAAYTVLYILEQAWSSIGYDLGEYPHDPAIVLLYTGQQFSEITQAPHWANGIFDGRIRLPVAGLPDKSDDDLRRLLYHEYTHVVVYRITKGKCPVWINEGIAQHMQERGSSSQDPWLRPSVIREESGAIPLKSLAGAFISLSSQDALKAYITSYFAVGYMIEDYGLSGLNSLLNKIGEGASLDNAMKDALGTSLDDFERRFRLNLAEKSD